MGLRVVLSTSISRSDRGKLSLGLVRFKSLKSTQTLILTSSSGTTTMLDTLRILDYFQKTSIPLLFNLCLYLDQDIQIGPSQPLLNRFASFYQWYPIQTRYILVGLGKKIYIILEQCNQLFSFLGVIKVYIFNSLLISSSPTSMVSSSSPAGFQACSCY